jgi:hypothetical protein
MAPLRNPNKTPPKLLIQLKNSISTILFSRVSNILKQNITRRKIIIKLIIFDRASFHLNCLMRNTLKS